MPLAVLYLLKLSISLSLMYLFYQLLLRRLTFYNCNRWYLLGYSLLSFIIPLINITHFFEKDPLDGALSIRYIHVTGNYSTVSATIPGMRYFFPGGAWNIVSGLLLLGSAFLLMRLVVWCLSIRKIRRKAKPLSGVQGEGSVELNAGTCVKIYQVDENIIPFSFGGAIYINKCLHTEKEWEEIILHEYVHVRQRHSLDILFAELICIVNWYNPFSWLIRHSIRQNLEFIADDKLVENGLDKKGYQYHLLKVVGQQQYRLANNFNFSSLKKRIIMMNKIKSARLHLVRFLFVLPLLAVLLLAFRDQYRHNAIQGSNGQHAEKNALSPSAGLYLAGRADTVPKNGADSLKHLDKQKLDKKDLDKFVGGLDSSLHNPLYIVDGMVIDGVLMTDKRGLSNLFLSDIVSIKIWKDEEAIRLYGEKARYGIVYISTRHGKLSPEAGSTVPEVPAVEPGAPEPPVPAVPVVATVVSVRPVPGTPTMVPVAPVPAVTPGAPLPVAVDTNDSVQLTSSEMVIHQDSSLVNIQFFGNGTAATRLTDGRPGVIKLTGSVKRMAPSTGTSDYSGLVILDGKEVPGTELKTLDPATIKNISVFKGEEAVKEYGEKGRQGVIVINSKK